MYYVCKFVEKIIMYMYDDVLVVSRACPVYIICSTKKPISNCKAGQTLGTVYMGPSSMVLLSQIVQVTITV